MEKINLLGEHPASRVLMRCFSEWSCDNMDKAKEIYTKGGEHDCELNINGIKIPIAPFFGSLDKLLDEQVNEKVDEKLKQLIEGSSILEKLNTLHENVQDIFNDAEWQVRNLVENELGIVIH